MHALANEIGSQRKRAEHVAQQAAKGEQTAQDSLARLGQAEAIASAPCAAPTQAADRQAAELAKGSKALDAEVFGEQGTRLQGRAEACRQRAAAAADPGSPPLPQAPRAPDAEGPPPLEVGVRGPGRMAVGNTANLAAVVRSGRPPYHYR